MKKIFTIPNILSIVRILLIPVFIVLYLIGRQGEKMCIRDRQCIVLDEPTAMLDPKGRDEVMDAIVSLNKNSGITIVLITHFMDEAVKADRVVVMLSLIHISGVKYYK